MYVNSVTFRFTEVGNIVNLEKILGRTKLSLGSGNRFFVQDGQLAIQFFGPLSNPTPEQRKEFENTLSQIKDLANALAQEEIK